MAFETLTLEMSEGIAVLTVNRPASLNALDRKVLEEISRALDHVEEDPSLVCLIITGQGPKAFVAGADVAAMENMSSEEATGFSKHGQELFARIASFPVPTIAAVNGFALGGGNELAMSCDVRIAARNARFGQPEVGLGITPGFGGTQRLPVLTGKGYALYLTLTGKVIEAEEAFRAHLVEKVVPEGQALAEALLVAGEIRKRSPFAVRQAKKAILDGLSSGTDDGLLVERRLFGQCFSCSEQKEGMRAFLEKRAPDYRKEH